MADKNYITIRGIEKLKEEYRELFQGERPELVKTVAWAASNGDRSENADYIYGKRRLREIDRRLKYLSDLIETAIVVNVDDVENEKVVFGATVTVENEDGHSSTYQIVGAEESKPEKKRISWKSPMAKALLGKTIDDEVVVKKPQGEEFYTIVEIQYQNYSPDE